jgi:hypothetical protein
LLQLHVEDPRNDEKNQSDSDTLFVSFSNRSLKDRRQTLKGWCDDIVTQLAAAEEAIRKWERRIERAKDPNTGHVAGVRPADMAMISAASAHLSVKLAEGVGLMKVFQSSLDDALEEMGWEIMEADSLTTSN